MALRRSLVTLLLLLLPATAADAATRLTYRGSQGQIELEWPRAKMPIAFVVDAAAAAAEPDAEAKIASGFQTWASVEGTAIAFAPQGVDTAEAGRDGKNTVSLSDDLFAASGFIAYTTTWFDESGSIEEADIQIDRSAIGRYDLEALVQHEVGHLLGLDHSAVISSAMYPFVSRRGVAPLDSDDTIAVATIYPASGVVGGASIRGEVRGTDGGIFGAQVVATNRDGQPVASTLTRQDGSFELRGLPDGDYALYAEPLDGPVGAGNLSGVWRESDSASFRTSFSPGAHAGKGGAATDGVVVSIDPLPPSLNPRWVGTFTALDGEVKLESSARRIEAGRPVAIAVGGDGVIGGMTTFEVMNRGFRRTSEFHYGSNYIWAIFEVAADTREGSVVIVMRSGDESAALTGGIIVEPHRRHRGVRR